MRTANRTLVTGFGAFGGFVENPSARLALGCGGVCLEVSYAAVEEWVWRVEGFERVLMLGVAGRSEGFRVERWARNWTGGTADVRGVVKAGLAIDPAGPARLGATLWPGELEQTWGSAVRWSDDAGDYLCNYLFYRALQRFPGKRVGFLHVPPVEVMGMERQREILGEILGWVEKEG